MVVPVTRTASKVGSHQQLHLFLRPSLSSHLDYSLGLMCNMVTKKCQDVDECTDTRYHFPHHITVHYIYHSISLYITIYQCISLYITIYHHITIQLSTNLSESRQRRNKGNKCGDVEVDSLMSIKRDQLRDSSFLWIQIFQTWEKQDRAMWDLHFLQELHW